MTVTIDPVNGVTSDGGLLFATNGYVIQGGPLNLNLGTNIIVLRHKMPPPSIQR